MAPIASLMENCVASCVVCHLRSIRTNPSLIRTLYEDVALVDTSAVIALHDPSDQHHDVARSWYASCDWVWLALDVTSHETFTRARYASSLGAAVEQYRFLRASTIRVISFEPEDELRALELLGRYTDQRISFHDAICAVVMKRLQLVRIFTFDSDFSTLGFQVFPGATY